LPNFGTTDSIIGWVELVIDHHALLATSPAYGRLGLQGFNLPNLEDMKGMET
jgi:hypothetical protein